MVCSSAVRLPGSCASTRSHDDDDDDNDNPAGEASKAYEKAGDEKPVFIFYLKIGATVRTRIHSYCLGTYLALLYDNVA